MYKLTREEALEAMIAGRKIKHKNFTHNEFLYINGGCIMTEDGYHFDDMFEREMFNDGWMVLPETAVASNNVAEPIVSVLHAIKLYPEEFKSALLARRSTSPITVNKKNHLKLHDAIEIMDWDAVDKIITNPEYRNPLKGVILCLNTYSGLELGTWYDICDLEENGNLI